MAIVINNNYNPHTMNVRINKRENPFLQIDKTPINDKRLSPASLGVLTYLLSKPDGWKANKKEILSRFQGADEIKTTINMIEAVFRELRKTGYAKLVPVKGEGGRVIGREYVINEIPESLTELPTSSGVGESTELPTSSDIGTSPTVGDLGGYSNNESFSNNEDSLIGKNEKPPKIEKPKFTPPQREEVLTVYAQIFTDSKVKNARAWADWEATKFFDHYTANGWKVGGKGRLTPMKNWQQAATRWAKKCIEDGISDKRLPDKYAATSAAPADFPKQRTLVF